MFPNFYVWKHLFVFFIQSLKPFVNDLAAVMI